MRRIILFLAVVSVWGQAPGPFTLTDLGLLSDFGGCIATAISPNGNVAGYCHPANAVIHTGPATRGFLYRDGTLTALPDLTGTTIINGVNDAGTVVGVSLPLGTTITNDVLNNFFAPFVYPAGAADPPARFYPAAVNATTLAGFYSALHPDIQAPNDLLQAALFSGGQLSLLTGATGANSLAFGISQKSVVAGANLTVDPQTFGVTMRPVLWQSGAPAFLPPPASEVASVALAVNDHGEAGGTGFNLRITPNLFDPLASYTMTDLRALVWTGGTLRDITAALGSTYGMVSGVNDMGWAVGFRADAFPAAALGVLDLFLHPDDAGFRAFLYAAGTAYDLNTLVTGASGWTITDATAVNDAGQIVGAGFLNGVEHAILLTPAAPPPPGPVIGGISGGGLSVPPVTSISANGYFTIGGANFAPEGTARVLEAADIVNATLPTKLASTCVAVGTSRAFLSYVSPGQINALGPALPAGDTVAVRVVTDCDGPDETLSAPALVSVEAATPEFLYWVQNADGQNPVIALDAVHGDYIGPPGLIAGLTFRPAKAGDILTLYGVSFGPTVTGPVPGAIPNAADSLPPGFSVTIGGRAAAVSYAGVTPGSAGLYQVNLTVPEGLAAGNHSIVLTANGVSTPAGGFLAVAAE